MTESKVSCQHCGAVAVYEGLLPRGAVCEECAAELRCCLNCRFYDTSAYNDCGEPSAERVVDKAKANFCDYFAAPPVAVGAAGGQSSGSPLSDLDSLFKK